MGDATRPDGDAARRLEELRAAFPALVGELTHAVLEVVRTRGLPLAEQLETVGGDPFELLELLAVTLRALADGLEHPTREWLDDA